MDEREPSFLGAPGGGADRPVVLPEPPPIARVAPLPRDDTHTVYVAGFWRRTVAAVVDAAVVLPLAIAVVWAASRLTGLTLPSPRKSAVDYWLDLVLAGDPGLLTALGLGAAVLVVYLLLFQTLVGRTLGMRLLGLRIIDVYGDPPVVWRAGLRALGYLVALATGGLGFLWVAFDREKRGLHDWLSGTYVIKPAPGTGRAR
jgi:uncharacterized RDD family membrane protein YckC